MPQFHTRSSSKELLDANNIPLADINRNLHELQIINSRLGGHSVTNYGVKQLIKKIPSRRSNSHITICEIGCGGGDNLAGILNWGKNNRVKIKCVGIDINPDCIKFAQTEYGSANIGFICADYTEGLKVIDNPDIIFSSLFCHHFTDDELMRMVQLMKQHATVGCFINDLHRHWLPYYSIKFLTKVFSKSYLVKNDAPLSVLRGFKKNEIENIFKAAEVSDVDISWRWAFRWLVIF